jgi:hypothetical protein
LKKFEDKSVFYADLHNHCNISYAHGSLEDALNNARQRLDVCSITGHAHWPDMPERDGKIDHIIDFHEEGFDKLKKGWGRALETMKRFNQEGSFVVFPGYEIHSMEAGDYTLVARSFDAKLMYPSSIDELRELLESDEEQRSRILAFPHHVAYKKGRRGINWEKFSSKVFPLVEIYSMHGCSESDETDRPFLHTMGPGTGQGSIQYGLGPAGARFGLLANTDHHSAHPGSYGHGLTGIWAESLERDKIWEALKQRRTYALSADKMQLKFAVNGEPMGSVAPLSNRQKIEFELKAGGVLDYVDIIKNGSLFARFSQIDFQQPASGRKGEGGIAEVGASALRSGSKISKKSLAGTAGGGMSRTILYLELGWGERRKAYQWRAKLGIRGGRILSVDARFRGDEVVSPLDAEGDRDGYFRSSWNSLDEKSLEFHTRTSGNPTNSTPATQGVAVEVEAEAGAEVYLEINGQEYHIDLADLREYSFVDYTGGLDSPSFKLHRAPDESEYMWAGSVEDGDSSPAYYYLRGRQKNGAWVWSSPVWVE